MPELDRTIRALARVENRPMNSQEWTEALLALPDEALDGLYSFWSEDSYAAGWMSDREQQFVDWMLALPESGAPEQATMQDYEIEGVANIRAALNKRRRT